MGEYINPGKGNFSMAVNSEIYIDKTKMIQYLNSVVNTNQRYVSVTRPRRFGKSMAADMICAYYDREADSREMFSKRKLAECQPIKKGNTEICWDTYLGKFDVIRIVMTDYFDKRITVEESLIKMQRFIVRELKKYYPQVEFFEEENLKQSIKDVYGEIEKQVVIVIDEWDAIFRVRQDDKEGHTEYLNFLRSLMKDNRYIALAYMTGILPIKKYGEHSALNMFDEYSVMQPMQMAEYTGFTTEEVQELCKEYNMSYEEISSWYDGYEVSGVLPIGKREEYRKDNYREHKVSIYSPLSVVKAMITGIIKNYWNKTETYEALAEHIRKDYDGLKESVTFLMNGERLKINTSTYTNDMTTFSNKDDILSLLVHLGYLGFDDETSEVFIPNKEILDEFKASTKTQEWTEAFKSFELSQELLKATWDRKEEKVAKILEHFHNQTANKTYNDEAALSYAIQLAYYTAQKYYTTVLELDTGKGYADVIYIPAPKYSDKPVLLIELKYEKNADTAISQIKRQEYPDRLEHYKGNILLIGINYEKDLTNIDPNFKHHSCIIERG